MYLTYLIYKGRSDPREGEENSEQIIRDLTERPEL
jgi:hypothetical protein